MKRVTALKILNPLLAVFAIAQVTNVIIIKISPSLALGELHEWNGYVIGVLVLLHFILNWNWIKMTYFSPKKKNTPLL